MTLYLHSDQFLVKKLKRQNLCLNLPCCFKTWTLGSVVHTMLFINKCLAVDSGRYLCTHSLHSSCAIWLNVAECFPRDIVLELQWTCPCVSQCHGLNSDIIRELTVTGRDQSQTTEPVRHPHTTNQWQSLDSGNCCHCNLSPRV